MNYKAWLIEVPWVEEPKAWAVRLISAGTILPRFSCQVLIGRDGTVTEQDGNRTACRYHK